MAQELVLVTGAAGGSQGQTGRCVTEHLLARGVAVRAFVHRLDERSERLRALGAEVYPGDLLELDSVRTAMRDVSRVYFAYPVQPGLLEATANMAVAAHEVGVSRLVNLVMLQSSFDAPTPRMRQNYASELVFDWANIGAVHVRATIFYENLRSIVRQGLAARDVMRLPWGDVDTRVPLVAAADVARVAAGVLVLPEAEAGTVYPLIGSVPSVGEIVATFGRVLGRDVRYEEISDAEYRADALARGLNAHALEHLSALFGAIRGLPRDAEFAVSDLIEAIGGQAPTALEEFVRGEVETLAVAR
jgi:uncharacterized protein YbjT (DUF2867 family)